MTTIGQLVESGVLEINDGHRMESSELVEEGGIPFLRGGNITEHGLSFESISHIDEELRGAIGRKISQPGDIVITTKGSVGRTAFVKERHPEFVYSPQLSYWRLHDESVVDRGYLWQWIHGHEFVQQMDMYKGQTTMADYFSLRDQEKVEISLPSLPQQRRIAGVLGALDDKIALNRRMNETLEAMAQALYRHWFIDFGPFQDGPFTESERGPIPQGWHLEPLDEVADFLNGTAWKRYAAEGDEESLPVLKIRELRGGFDEKSDRASKKSLPDKYNIDDGDVIFSWSGSLLLKRWSGGPGALNQHLFKVTSERFPRWFFYQWIRHYIDYFRRIAESKATTMGHIKRSHLSESLVAVPPSQTLAEMNETMAPLMQRQYANDLEMRKLAETRDYLLPKLISGEVAVPEAKTEAREAVAAAA